MLTNTITSRKPGRNVGSVTCRKRCHRLAPSTLAARYRSAGTAFIVTSSRIAASGTSFHTSALPISSRVLQQRDVIVGADKRDVGRPRQFQSEQTQIEGIADRKRRDAAEHDCERQQEEIGAAFFVIEQTREPGAKARRRGFSRGCHSDE